MYKITLMFTERCNIACRHCCVSENDFFDQERDMPLSEVFHYIDQMAQLVAQYREQYTISFSGGEAFIRFPDLLEAVRYAKKNGAYHLSCMTNGFWGKDPVLAQEWANELNAAGLNLIGFSIDDFHQQFVPLDSLRNAFQACRNLGMEVTIKSVVTRKTRRLPAILGELGDLLLNYNVVVQEIACIPEGRASHTIGSDEWLYQKGIPEEPCMAGIMLAIFPDGSTFPCCGTGWNRWLILGNAHVEPIAELFQRAESKSLCVLLREKGPKYFVSFFQQAGHPLPSEGYANSCHLCGMILNHPQANSVVPQAILEWKTRRVQSVLGNFL
jgi:hypothetical protein